MTSITERCINKSKANVPAQFSVLLVIAAVHMITIASLLREMLPNISIQLMMLIQQPHELPSINVIAQDLLDAHVCVGSWDASHYSEWSLSQSIHKIELEPIFQAS